MDLGTDLEMHLEGLGNILNLATGIICIFEQL